MRSIGCQLTPSNQKLIKSTKSNKYSRKDQVKRNLFLGIGIRVGLVFGLSKML